MTVDISIIIPTLNSEKVLPHCLESIKRQNFPSNNYEIIISDGGSIDNTISIAKKYHAKIVKNPLKTAEAGKAVALKHSTGKYIALIDSDNILPHPDWISQMLKPFQQNPKIIGIEPIEFTYQTNAGFIERYSALIGANDPYAFISGVSDRKNYINHRWTALDLKTKRFKNFTLIKLYPKKPIPTIGANGTVFRTDFLKKNLHSDYLFDIDIITQVLNKYQKPLLFAKVHTGIIHTYCESSISKFYRKQKRRLTDYYTYRHLRNYDWDSSNKTGIIKFSLYTLSFIFPLIDSFRGFFNQPDAAWFFHPLACLLTLFVYSKVHLAFILNQLKPVSRQTWQQ